LLAPERIGHSMLFARSRVTFDLARPAKKPEHLSLLCPEQIPEIARSHGLRSLP